MTAVVKLDPDHCPDCGADLHRYGWDQPALLRHGGYGATQRTVVRACRCGWRITAERGDVAPKATL